MAAQTAEGIILRKYLLRETSYILVVFTKEFGKIRGVIKGVRNPYPQFAGNFEVFTKAKVLFYRKKKKPLDLITGCETLDYFVPVRKDLERLTYANYFIELVDIVAVDGDANIELYNILDKSLKLLATNSSPKRISRIFEVKLLKAIGLQPEFNLCTSCGKSDEEANVFSVSGGGLVCRNCSGDGKTHKVSKGTINFLRKIQETDLEKTGMIKVSNQVGKEIEGLLRSFLRFHINKPIKTLKFINSLEKQGIIKT